ncbi:DUF559 domain-containing protein [Agromyces sp. NPDC057679]|uniref:DUF559 domain-containing protein n=1 Tax=Agromyces sp. NPDC057679 TaxID=3346207 RepID=UPI003670E289
MPRLLELVDAFGGIVERSQLLDRGIRSGTISRALATGEIRRVRRSHYARPDASTAAMAAVRVGGRLGCVSAAERLGLWCRKPGPVHVSLPANAARLRTNRVLIPDPQPLTPDRSSTELVLHWTDVPFGARARDERAWCVPVTTALSELARCAARIDVLAAFESAVAARLVPLAAATELLAARTPPGFGLWQLTGLDGSGAETYLADALRRARVSFAQQVPFDRVGFVDFLVGGRLVVEVDGYAHHSSRDAFARDRRRDVALLERGVRVLRFTALEVLAEPDLVVATILRVLAQC